MNLSKQTNDILRVPQINGYYKIGQSPVTWLVLFLSAEIETARNFHNFKTNDCVSKIQWKRKTAFKKLN